MRRQIWTIWAIVAAGMIAAGAVRAESDPVEKSRELYSKALAAYNEKDYPEYLRVMREIDGIRRNHPRVVYMLAGAYALNGEKSRAIEELNRLADLGLVAEPAEDSDFNSIANTDGFNSAVARLADNAKPIGNSKAAFTIPQKQLIPEGIANDPLTGYFYVSSVYQRGIVEIRPGDTNEQGAHKAHEVRSFGSWESGDGLWSVFALCVDPARRLLWACSSAIEQTRWVTESEVGYAGVFKYDLTTRLVVERFVLSNARGKHLFGDMVLSRSGKLYVTDTIENSIYRIDEASGVFERWLDPQSGFSSLQGITFDDEERYLFVADYSHGIFRINSKNREIRRLPFPDDMTILGIDGIAFYNNGLIAIQNGIRPHRVIRLQLSERLDRITGWEVLEANHPGFDEPTLGIVVPSRDRQTAAFYYVANSHWGAFDREGKLRESADLTEPLVLKLELE